MNFNKLIPELSVSDFDRSLAFYVKILGFKIEYERKKFAFLSLEGSQIMIQEINNVWDVGKLEHPYGRGINLQIQVKDVQSILDNLKNNDCAIFEEVKDNWYKKNDKLLGNREFLIQDPDGYLLRFSQDLGSKHIH